MNALAQALGSIAAAINPARTRRPHVFVDEYDDGHRLYIVPGGAQKLDEAAYQAWRQGRDVLLIVCELRARPPMVDEPDTALNGDDLS